MSFWQRLELSPAGASRELAEVLAAIPWNADGLIAAVAQQHDSGEVLMLAWMNPESLRLTLKEGRACYWSRSRRCLWRKGATSGHVQHLVSAHLDCDGDALLLQVDQAGPACHTGRRTCFYNRLSGAGLRVVCAAPGLEVAPPALARLSRLPRASRVARACSDDAARPRGDRGRACEALPSE